MNTEKKNKMNENSQQQKFIDAAKEHECDESEEAFDEAMKKLLGVKAENPHDKKLEKGDS